MCVSSFGKANKSIKEMRMSGHTLDHIDFKYFLPNTFMGKIYSLPNLITNGYYISPV